jgi:hypothetical protein
MTLIGHSVLCAPIKSQLKDALFLRHICKVA